MSATTKRRQPGTLDPQALLMWFGISVVVLVIAAVAIPEWIDAAVEKRSVPRNPFLVTLQVFQGKLAWTENTTVIAGILCLLVASLLTFAIAGLIRHRAAYGRTIVDRAANHMGRGAALKPITRAGARAKAKRIGSDFIGLPIARTVAGNVELISDAEACTVAISGPRTMKTSGLGIPRLLEAPGAAVITTRFRDIVDATRDPRADTGRVWVFDPQDIIQEPPTWWFNPLANVTDEITAGDLASLFMAAARKPGDRGDSFFDPKANTLISSGLLAAAVSGQPITVLHDWLTNETDDTMVDILRDNGWHDVASGAAAIINSVPKQRGGVYGTATNAMGFLISEQITRWITPGYAPAEQFNARDFIRSTDTLYCASKTGGAGSAAGVVTALAVAVMKEAERAAATSPGGRLETPLTCILDEVANVCRWPELPEAFSFYGGRGILLDAYLQNWAQGAGVWGEAGMQKMWSAANIKIYGGGEASTAFLGDLVKVIGEFTYNTRSANSSRTGQSINTAATRENILDVSDLATLPTSRAIVMGSGFQATLARTAPWWTGRHAPAIHQSIAAHTPAGEPRA